MKHLVETWLSLSLTDCNDYGVIFVMATWIGSPIIIIWMSGEGAVEQVEKSNESKLWVQIMRINELWLLYNEIETRRHLSLGLDLDMDLERVTAIYSRAISSGQPPWLPCSPAWSAIICALLLWTLRDWVWVPIVRSEVRGSRPRRVAHELHEPA